MSTRAPHLIEYPLVSFQVLGVFDLGIDRVQPFFKNITVETRVTSRDLVEKIAEAARLTHQRCPVHATLSRATEMTFKLVVNGENVPL